MTQHPPSEVSLTIEDVDRLVASQYPQYRGPLELVAHGWDNEMYRLGEAYAVRLPRRALAAPYLEHEQRSLAELASRLPVPVPAPIAIGRPDGRYPWAWSIVPWFQGERAMDLSAEDRDALAEELAAVLIAFHTPAPEDAPRNPVRGVPFIERDAVVRERLAAFPELLAIWAAAVEVPPWGGPRLWIHGDLHPANVLVRTKRIAALLDFGDTTAGDPAYDLAAAWAFFTPEGRARFRTRLAGRYDTATWTRARGFAASSAGLGFAAPEGGFGRLAEHTAAQLAHD